MTEKKLIEQTTLLSVFEEFTLEEVRKDSWKNVILYIKDKILEHHNYEDLEFTSLVGNDDKSIREIESLLEEIANSDTFTADYHFQVNEYGYLYLKDNKVEFRFEDNSGDNYYYHAQLLSETKGLDED